MYLRVLAFVSILGLHCISVRAETAMSWLSPEWRRIARDERVLLNELVRLPDVSERHLTGRLGYHSRYSEKQDTVEWVELRLPQAHTMDAVVLIAATLDSNSATRSGYGFPLRFRVEIFNDNDASERTIIAD
jgi:hypothetical protein